MLLYANFCLPSTLKSHLDAEELDDPGLYGFQQKDVGYEDMWIYADSWEYIYIYVCLSGSDMIDSFLFGRSFRPGGLIFRTLPKKGKYTLLSS